MNADVPQYHTELKIVEREKPDLSSASDVEIRSPVLEKPRVPHENLFFRNLTWYEVKQSRRCGRKQDAKSSNLQVVAINGVSAMHHSIKMRDLSMSSRLNRGTEIALPFR